MTRKEALKVLRYRSGWNLSIRDANALDMAIKALNQETCEDAISREAILNDLKECMEVSESNYEFGEVEGLRKAIESVNEMPSVQPKTGQWIPCSERLPKTSNVYRVTRYYPNNETNPNYLVDACYFDGSDTWYNDNRINHGRPYVDNVIAWQENPEPYKPESEES